MKWITFLLLITIFYGCTTLPTHQINSDVHPDDKLTKMRITLKQSGTEEVEIISKKTYQDSKIFLKEGDSITFSTKAGIPDKFTLKLEKSLSRKTGGAYEEITKTAPTNSRRNYTLNLKDFEYASLDRKMDHRHLLKISSSLDNMELYVRRYRPRSYFNALKSPLLYNLSGSLKAFETSKITPSVAGTLVQFNHDNDNIPYVSLDLLLSIEETDDPGKYSATSGLLIDIAGVFQWGGMYNFKTNNTSLVIGTRIEKLASIFNLSN